MASLWRDSFVRGPCQPSCSGRHHDRPTDRLVRRSQQRSVQTHISANASIGPAATQAAPVTTTSSSSSPTCTWSMETIDDDWAFESTTVGLSSSKALKINLDLKLVSGQVAKICTLHHQHMLLLCNRCIYRCTSPVYCSCSWIEWSPKSSLQLLPPQQRYVHFPRGTPHTAPHTHDIYCFPTILQQLLSPSPSCLAKTSPPPIGVSSMQSLTPPSAVVFPAL